MTENVTVVAKAKSIDIPAESETARLLRAADDTPTAFIVDGARDRVLREPASDDVSDGDPWADYDPQRAIDGMRAAAGSWRDVDGVRLKADIRRWREEGSREPIDS